MDVYTKPTLTSALLIATACLGCDDGWQAETYPAAGSLFINGQPAENALVQLDAAEKEVDVRDSRPWALVQPDGSFTLSTYARGDGAPAGEYRVIITWPPNPHVMSHADRLGRQFDTPEESRWRVTIHEGENKLDPIRLTNVPVKKMPKQPTGARSTKSAGPAQSSP